jgi:flagellar hook-associated protein 1 FlgK
MSLGAVLNSARSSLAALSERTRVTSENIANVDNPDYSRRIAENVPGTYGVQRVAVQRAEDREILAQMLDYTSMHAGNEALVDGLDQLERAFGGPDGETSPAALLARLRQDLQAFAAMPDSGAAARQVVTTARTLADSLRRGAQAVQDVRTTADAEMARSVARINELLARFHEANAAIVSGRLSDAELARQKDARDAVLADLAEEIDIRTVERPDGGLAIYTTSGAVLYEKQPRAVSFVPTGVLAAGVAGNQVFVDGVPVTGEGAILGVRAGRLKSLAELRDRVSLDWQTQLDELARGIIEVFAEHDQGSPPGPDLAGLFTWSGGPDLPPAGTHVPGLATQIRVNAAVDPESGGNPFLIRDGGINGPSYLENAAGHAGYTQRLLELDAALGAPRAFDPAAGLETEADVAAFAASSLAWLEQARTNAVQNEEYSAALLGRASEALSRATGVDLDAELATMMRLERTWQASARLIQTVDQMLASLLEAAR